MNLRQKKEMKGISIAGLVKAVMVSYLLTFLLLAMLSLLLYKLGIGVKFVSISIICIYVLSTFVAGFLTGRRAERRKYLWGLVVGLIYFLVLMVLSFLLGRDTLNSERSIFTTFILCAAGGMLGGMFG